MGKRGWAAICALALGGCGGGAGPAALAPPDAGQPDAGEVAQAAPPPPSVTFTTSRGTLTGPEAFAVRSAQALFQGPDGGATYAGFQLSDSGQCLPADIDGGAGSSTGEVTHVLGGFVRTFDGQPVQPGTYAVGMADDGGLQTYVSETEFDRQTGSSRTFLATGGQVTITALAPGHLEANLDVSLGDPLAQQQLPLSGSFSADACGTGP